MTQKMKTAIYVSAQSVATIFKGIVLMKSTTLIMLFYRKLTAVCQVCVFSCSVVPNVFRPHGLHSPWTSPGQISGMGSLSLLQGIFLTQESNRGLLHCRGILH